MENEIRYVLDIDNQLRLIDDILVRYQPLCVDPSLRFSPYTRYPVYGEEYSLYKGHSVISSRPYYPWVGLQSVLDSLSMLIYAFRDDVQIYIKNPMLEVSKNFCPFFDTEVYEIFYNKFGIIMDNDFTLIHNNIMFIFRHIVKPLIPMNDKNIWEFEIDKHIVLLVNKGNIYEHRFKELQSSYRKEK